MLTAAGFNGFVRFADLPSTNVSTGPGVYAVLRDTDGLPRFREQSPAGWFKGKDPTVPIERLRERWIEGVHCLYIGKADPGAAGRRGLARRLSEYRRHGEGLPVGHWGGRLIWQLEDADQLLVAWKKTDGLSSAAAEETRLLTAFVDEYGRLPFANLRR